MFGKGMMKLTVQAHGKVSTEWVEVPKPDVIAINGMRCVRPYVTRMLSSTARFASLVIFTGDGQRGLYVMRYDDSVSLGIHVAWRHEPDKEQNVRQFFSDRGIVSCQDSLAGNGRVPDATHVLRYPLAGDAEQIAKICKQVLREIHGVEDLERLDFTFQEK